MKLFKKVCIVALGILLILGILLFFSRKTIFQTQNLTHIPTQNTSSIIQKAKKLLVEGIKTSDPNLMYQAKDNYSIWLEQNENNPDKKLIADVLRSRATTFIMLSTFHENTLNKAINDYEKSIQYDPIGEVQFQICLMEKDQNNSSNLQDCYRKAADIFEKKNTPKTYMTFLIARILSGDKSAITDYRKAFQASEGNKRKLYQDVAKGYLDQATYEEITK